MNRFSIRDIENLTEVKAHTLRVWEQRYGILTPKRTATNIRYYDNEDLMLALRIGLLNTFGYKISKICNMTVEEMNRLILKIQDPEFKVQVKTNELIDATLKFDTLTFEEIINNYTRQHGVEATIEQLIFRFMENVGTLWLTGHLIPAQEHFASNIIARKLAVACEAVPLNKAPSEVTVLLLLPEGEIHDLALNYVYYMLRKKQVNTIYIGANTPIDQVEAVYNFKKPTHAYLHLTAVGNEFNGSAYLKKISSIFINATIYISGIMVSRSKLPSLENIKYLYSLKEVKKAMEALS